MEIVLDLVSLGLLLLGFWLIKMGLDYNLDDQDASELVKNLRSGVLFILFIGLVSLFVIVGTELVMLVF